MAKEHAIHMRLARRVAIAIAGSAVVALGVAMIFLPGPGIVTILAGLGILSAEFAFARRWFVQLHAHSQKAADKARIPKQARWWLVAGALVLSLAGITLTLFYSAVWTGSGLRVVRKPQYSYRHSWTTLRILQSDAASGDGHAAAILSSLGETAQAPPAPAPENR